MQNTVKQHYVPQFYLKHFVDDNSLLHIYDLKQKKIFTQIPKNICYEKNLYETKWENANPKLGEFILQNQIENIFCECESKFSKVLSIILKVCTPLQNPNALILHGEERNIFFQFIINMLVRNPQSMAMFSLNEMELDMKNNKEMHLIKALLDYIGFGGTESLYCAAKKKAFLTEKMENNFPAACIEVLKNYNYTFFYAKDSSFITSNVPVCVGEDPTIKENDKTSIYFVLSPKVAVLFGNYKNFRNFKNRLVCIEEKYVKNLNRIFIKHNDNKRFLISNSDENLDLALKLTFSHC